MLTWMYVSIMLVIRVFTNVRVQFEPDARMILDAVLLSIAKISGKRDASHAVAILSEMRLNTGEGVMISHPILNFQVYGSPEMWIMALSNTKITLRTKVCPFLLLHSRLIPFAVRMLGVDAPRSRVLTLAAGRLFLIGAKRLSDTTSSLSQHMPEAVTQALALSELTRYGVQYHVTLSDRSYYALAKTLFVSVCRMGTRGSLPFSRKELMVNVHTTRRHLFILRRQFCKLKVSNHCGLSG